MKKLLLAAAALLAAASGCTPATTTPGGDSVQPAAISGAVTAVPRTLKVVIFGDSTSEGDYRDDVTDPVGDTWVQPFAHRAQAAGLVLDIDNWSLGGAMIDDPRGDRRTVRQQAQSYLRNNTPDVIILNAGINDILNHSDEGMLDTMNAVEQIVGYAGSTPVHLVAPLPICGPEAVRMSLSSAADIPVYRQRWQRYVDWLHARFDPYGQLLDLDDTFGDGDCSLYQDNLHPNVAGYHLYADSIPLGWFV